MAIRDVGAMNASLDNDYGPTRGPNSPPAHQLALFVGDPFDEGVELDPAAAPGYARVTVLPAAWPPAEDGIKATDVQLPPVTDEWADAPTHWALYGSDGATMWDCNPLSEPIDVTGPGDGPVVTVTIFYDESVEEA